ncbi:MAG TPA: peptide ABC transporter substrate-binding protein [Aliidongia sp.]|nr:peptide ABC transporter substrate-binding protein [Aliidongia sp.]
MRARLILLAFLLLASLPAWARPGDLVIGMSQFPSSLHADIDSEVVKSYVLGFVVRHITAYDKDWRNSCLLCTELPTLENGLARIEDLPGGGQGMAVTIKLKPGLAWGDGEPVTARDIAFTWRLGHDPRSGFSNVHPWSRASRVEIVDDLTAVLHLDKIMTSFDEWDEILPEHIEGPVAARSAGDYIKQTLYNRAPTTAGLYDGPFLITGYKSGAEIILEPNPHWPGTKPGFQRIILKLIDNTAALAANLLSGDVDMVVGEGVGLSIDQALQIRKQHPDQFTYIFRPNLTFEHVDLQKDNPILADLRVRRALLYALDRKTLTDKLSQGLQPVAASWVSPLNPNFSPDAPGYPYDPAKAKTLLAEAGWTPGDDGICRNAKGERLSFELMTTSGNRLRELQEQVLQSWWKAACIETNIKNEPPRTLFGETMKKRTYGGAVMYGFTYTVTGSPRLTLGTDMIPRPENNYGGVNFTGFSNPEMDADIEAVESELDPVKRHALWADMQRIFATELPALPLFFRSDAHIIPKWLKGYEPTGHADYGTFWAENWHRE